MWRCRPAVMALFLVGCGEDGETEPAVVPCLPPNRALGESCLAPGVQDDGCSAGTIGLGDGSCAPAGVRPEQCAAGFVHDGDAACEPILPTEPCGEGFMAVPGESECRPVMACGRGKWGELRTDGATEHVDASFTGTSNGDEDAPWKTIGEAVAAAEAGALVAVAAGSYAEDVLLADKPVRLWGICPELVTVVGAGVLRGAILVDAGADGSEIGGMAVTGANGGVVVSSAEEVRVDRVWVHDTVATGIYVRAPSGLASLTVTGSLVEHNGDYGVYASGSEVRLEHVVVRDSVASASATGLGRGVNVRPQPETNEPSSLEMVGTLIERNFDAGVSVSGSTATLEGVVVRDTAPHPLDPQFGIGLGAAFSPSSGAGSDLTVVGALIERHHAEGVAITGSRALLEGVVVRDIEPAMSDQRFGRGIALQAALAEALPSVSLSGALCERTQGAGFYMGGGEATIEGLLVRDTLGASISDRGIGVTIERAIELGVAATATLRGVRVEAAHTIGVLVAASDATLEGVLVSGTLPSTEGDFGDGIAVVSELAAASAVVVQSRVEGSARAGIGSFGALAAIEGCALACNGFDLDVETFQEQPGLFDDRGGSACGCPTADGACKAVSASLEPPVLAR